MLLIEFTVELISLFIIAAGIVFYYSKILIIVK